MSSEFEVSCEKDGFFRCQMCPRRFVTKIGFENHTSKQHQKEVGTKLDRLRTENDPNGILVYTSLQFYLFNFVKCCFHVFFVLLLYFTFIELCLS